MAHITISEDDWFVTDDAGVSGGYLIELIKNDAETDHTTCSCSCSCGEADISGLLADAVKILREYLSEEQPSHTIPARQTLAFDILRMANISGEAE